MSLEILDATMTLGAVNETSRTASMLCHYITRPFVMTDGWTRVRIGVRHNYRNGTANVVTPSPYYIGLCSGPLPPSQSMLTDHFIGIKTTNDTWVTNASNGARSTSVNWAVCSNVNGVESLTNVTASSACLSYDARTATFIEITRGATYNVAVWSTGYTTNGGDLAARFVQEHTFRHTMSAAVIPTGSNQFVSLGNVNIAANETLNGHLDHLAIAWFDTVWELHVCDYAIERLA